MRTAWWLLALASGACASATPQAPRLGNAARDPAGSVVDGTQLATGLVALHPGEVIRLVNLGWFQKADAHHLAWFSETSEPMIADDERSLFLAVAHPGDPPDRYPRVEMKSYSWAESLGTHAARVVSEEGSVTITHVGRFDAAAGRVWFFMDEELAHRIDATVVRHGHADR